MNLRYTTVRISLYITHLLTLATLRLLPRNHPARIFGEGASTARREMRRACVKNSLGTLAVALVAYAVTDGTPL